MTKLKESNIVNHLVNNWDKYFENTIFWKTEYSLRNFRVDIASYVNSDFKEKGKFTQVPIFIEVKYNSNMRDLMFELQKQISFRDFYTKYGKSFCMICVISDEFDYDMVRFMTDNNIEMLKINIKDDDLESMTLTEYSLVSYEKEEIQDKL